DPAGHFFAFEAGATKQGGGQGWADVWYKGHFAIEYKGPDGNLARAYSQLLQYRESLQNPPLLIVCNLQEIVIHTNFTNSVKAIITLTLEDLLTSAGLTALRNLFYHPEAFRPQITAAQVTEEAATHFARLATHLGKWSYPPHAIAHYSIRLLFCLFAEDIALLPHNLFTRIVENGRQDARRFNQQARQLFAAMAEGANFGEHTIRWFNGGLFDGADVLEMDSEGVDLLQRIAQLDWSSIEPSIFGTLFTRSLDPDQRARLGAQYTSKADIVLIVEPVLMAPLRKAWKAVQVEAQQLAQKRDRATTRAAATQANQALNQCILAFAAKLATTRVLDPACGSGNFLYVALRLLLDLWKEVALFAGELGLPMLSPLPGLAPSPAQLYGIEINDYAHELAQATVWIGYLQWLHDNGYGFPSDPVLKPLDTIQQMDAILAFDEQGKPVEPAWPAAEVIVGNPPFLGGGRLRSEFGDKYVDALFALYLGAVPSFSDLVCYWFEMSRRQVLHKPVRCGLLATNSIRGGVNRHVLEQIKNTGDIFYAWSDRAWVLDGANVRVSMIGFDDGSEQFKMLNGISATNINSDLTRGIDLTTAQPLIENFSIQFEGTKKGADFDIPYEVAQEMLKQPSNIDGCHNSDVVKPWANAFDLTRGSRSMWIIDFGVDMTLDQAIRYQSPFNHIDRMVRPKYEKKRSRWWLHERPRPEMRVALSILNRFVVTPRHSKYRLFLW
ncbi:MAG: DNA methyltransferase, partial [Caldilinea sp.]